MLNKIKSAIYTYLINFIELQLVITLMSLPILISWGLPISYMSLLTNLIFTPLLIIFLWVSCLFTICTLLNLPCNLFTSMLQLLTKLWMWLLSFSKPSWLIGFSLPIFWISLIICATIVIIYTYKKPKELYAITFLSLLCCCILSARWYTAKNICKQVGNLPMIALKVQGKNYVIDFGALSAKQNFYNNIDYTIMPELIKHTGITNIDTLVLCKPTKRLAKITMQFAKQTNIQTIIATTKDSCFKTLSVAYKDSSVKVLPLKRGHHKKITLK